MRKQCPVNFIRETIKGLFNIGRPGADARNSHIDAMKGVAIILVVLGHSIQVTDPDYDNNVLFRIIYSFHLPLFMFLSGLVLPKQLVYSIPAYLKKNALRLVLPFIVWYSIGFVVVRFNQNVGFWDYLINLALYPDRGLWFLWVLFINSTMLFSALTVVRLNNLSRWENHAVIAVILVTRTFSTDVLGLAMVKNYFPYYVAGFFVYKYFGALKGRRAIIYGASLLFPLLVLGWRRNAFPSFYPTLLHLCNDQHIARLIVSIYKYAVSFLGIIFASAVLENIKAFRFNAFLCGLGTVTFDIYVCHGYFLIGFGAGPLRYLSAFVMAMTLSLGLTLVLRRIRIMKLLLFGQMP